MPWTLLPQTVRHLRAAALLLGFKYRVTIDLALATGLDPARIAALSWDDFDARGRRLTSGGEEIPIPDALVYELELLGVGEPRYPWLFPSRNGRGVGHVGRKRIDAMLRAVRLRARASALPHPGTTYALEPDGYDAEMAKHRWVLGRFYARLGNPAAGIRNPLMDEAIGV